MQYVPLEVSISQFGTTYSCGTPDGISDTLPDVPTMICTRLQLELLLQAPFVDLSAVSEVILADAGATLQLLRLIGEEFTEDEDRPTRIEDCIASLNVRRCYEAVCASSVSHDSPVLRQWHRSRRVAQSARELAKCIDGFSPEEAYLVGLLHEVGKFPQLLGWKNQGDSSYEQDAMGVMLADYWHLPGYLLSAIREQQESLKHARWTEFLQVAELTAQQAEALGRPQA